MVVLARVGAVLAAVAAVSALPLDWVRLGRAATLLAAGLQQPQNAVQVLGERRLTDDVTDPSQTVMAPPAAELPSADHAPLFPADDPAAPTIAVPKEDGSGGKVYTRKLDTGDTRTHGVAVRNSSGKTVDIAAALATKLTPKFTDTDAPQVLIIHTHTTEEYLTYDAGYYNAVDRERTTEHARNVCAAGDAVVRALAAQGVAAIHDKTVHDSPYSGAYTRSAKTVQSYLKQYPSIQVVLDLHRDALMEGASGLVKPTVTIDGKSAAQMMIIAGVLSTDTLPNPHWQQNLALAAQWQKSLTAQYDGLMRPLSTVGSRYNQHLHAGYLLVEVGSEGNTVAEAEYSGEILGKTLAELLKQG
jgi:stage II sporulation protein P